MKKGFTLIELLAVIVVLGIIGVITIPIFNNFIETSRTKAFKESEKALIRATRNYLNFNEELYPNDNEVRIVSIKTLQDQKFVDRIKSPSNNNCSGYVAVVKNYEGNYQFSPHYRCDGTLIESPTADGLVLNYTFDDFQEPTVNLFPHDGSFEVNNNTHIGNVLNSNGTTTLMGGGWRCATHYNDGICKIEEGGLFGNKKLTWYHNDVNGWKGATLTSNYNLLANRTYTMSVYTRINKTNTSSQSAYAFYGPEGYRHYFTWEKTPHLNPNVWIRGTRTFTPDINVSGGVFLYGISTSPAGIVVDYDGYQVEEKPYATPFTYGTREGVIKDYSNTNLNANLVMTTTPRWTNERGGSYYFDGNNKQIRLSNFNRTSAVNGVTYSMWYKINQEQGYLLWQNNAILIDVGHASSPGQMRLRMSLGGDWRSTHSWNYSLNKWTHLVITWDGTNTRIYQDGIQLVHSTSDSAYSQTTISTADLDIGFRDSYFLNGSMDDLKIYNRALSVNEIQNIYAIEKLR